jgi:hypothetical protein
MTRTVRTPKKKMASSGSAKEAQAARRDGQKEKFLEALSEGSSVEGACRGTGIGRQTAYDWRSNDKEFAIDWECALKAGTGFLEDEAVKRAMDHSDTLLIFLLKARKPEMYCDKYRAMKHSQERELPSHKIDIASLSDKQLRDLMCRLDPELEKLGRIIEAQSKKRTS